LICSVAGIAAAPSRSAARRAPKPPQAAAAQSPLLQAMQQEMDREMGVLSKTDPAAYFASYTLTDTQRTNVTGSNGALLSSQTDHSRWLESQVRVGSYDFDNTHHVGNQREAPVGSYGETVPVDDDTAVLKRAMWRETELQYRAAAEAYIKAR